MKKFLIGVVALLSICACDPVEWLAGHSGLWYLKNVTDVPLKITCSRTSDTIVPGDSILIYRSFRYLGDNEFPPFGDILNLDSIYVYDTDGRTLCEWLLKNIAVDERSVYEEENWMHYKEQVEGPTFAFIWVFDIQNGDISNVNP